MNKHHATLLYDREKRYIITKNPCVPEEHIPVVTQWMIQNMINSGCHLNTIDLSLYIFRICMSRMKDTTESLNVYIYTSMMLAIKYHESNLEKPTSFIGEDNNKDTTVEKIIECESEVLEIFKYGLILPTIGRFIGAYTDEIYNNTIILSWLQIAYDSPDIIYNYKPSDIAMAIINLINNDKQSNTDILLNILKELIPNQTDTETKTEANTIKMESMESKPIAQSCTLIKKIGEGSYGKVYKATIKEDNTYAKKGDIVALKVQENICSNKTGVEKYVIRCLSVLQFTNHPNIVKVMDTNVDIVENKVYTVFEKGMCDLATYIEHKGRLDISSVKYIVKHTLSALHYLHRHSIIHRDVKPQNILMVKQGKCIVPKLIDFDLAKDTSSIALDKNINDANSEPLHTTETTTLWFRAPELLECDSDYTATVDIWALGITLLYLLFDKYYPSEANAEDQLKAINDMYKNQFLENIPDKGASDLLLKMLEYDGTKRISAKEAFYHPFLQQ